MADRPYGPDDPEIPEAVAAPKRRWSLSLVWLIPVVVALIGGWLAAKAILERGPTVTISFATAEGLEVGKTKIKYKNVDIGEVTDIALSQDRSRVIVTAQFSKQAESILVTDTRFWVVRPRIDFGGVSGLGTLFSGSYVGVDAGTSTQPRREFTGLEIPPVFTADLPGRQFLLHDDDLGSLGIGSPVYFRYVPVGQVVAFELDKDGKGVTLKVFVNAPYDQYVTTNTRFWHASGIDVTLDATGVKIDSESLATIVLGGIAFLAPPDAPVSSPAEANAVFPLFVDRALAMKSHDTETVTRVFIFDESVRGLSPGAPVDFRGIIIGEVTSIGVDFDPIQKSFHLPVEARIYPARLRARYRRPTAGINQKELVNSLVARGFRAQLRTGNLLTGQLYVALDFFPKSMPVKIDWTKTPIELPTVPSGLEELQGTLSRLAKKLDKVPFDTIGADFGQAVRALEHTLQSADQFVKRLDKDVTPEARAALEAVRGTLSTVGRTLATDAPLQQDMREALRELSKAARALRVLADYLERHPEALIRGKKEEP